MKKCADHVRGRVGAGGGLCALAQLRENLSRNTACGLTRQPEQGQKATVYSLPGACHDPAC